MRNTIKFAIIVACLAGISGCTTMGIMGQMESGTKVTDAALASFTKGKTTKDEVVAALGGPQDIRLGGGKQILMYKYYKSGMMTDEACDTMLIFDEKGILENIMKSKGTVPDHHTMQ